MDISTCKDDIMRGEKNKTYLLNEKAYEIITGVSAKELFGKDKALKQYDLTEKDLKLINPRKTDDPQKAKIFFYDKQGMSRVYFIGNALAIIRNNNLSKNAYKIGREAGGYIK